MFVTKLLITRRREGTRLSLEQSATFGAVRLLMLIMASTVTTLELSRRKVRRRSRLTTSALAISAAEMEMMKVVPLDRRPMKLRYLFKLRRKQLPFTVIRESTT